MEIIYQSDNGKIVHSDNIEAMKKIKENSVDSCISDFPYDLSFMSKKWDNTGNFYEWNKARAIELYRIIKPGGYVCIFGHPKTNHRMKSAFEDAGFNIVEEIDWVYLTGMPKNQDIGKLFDKKAGVERKIVGIDESKLRPNRKSENEGAERVLAGGFSSDNGATITEPFTEEAIKWNGWKTAGLKPAHEPITVFQKPLEGTYINNINKFGCSCMNIDACRVPISQADIDMLNAKASKKPTTNYSDKEDKIYGAYAEDKAMPANPNGRFPANVIMDEYVAQLLDEQTGITKSSGGRSNNGFRENQNIYGAGKDDIKHIDPGFGDIGGGSKNFIVIKYQQKVSPKERLLPNGERNPHVTLKPVELIKWLIKLVTPLNGKTIDITAGSCTHAVACEELNKEGYSLKYIDVELLNTEEEPHCNIGKMRVQSVVEKVS